MHSHREGWTLVMVAMVGSLVCMDMACESYPAVVGRPWDVVVRTCRVGALACFALAVRTRELSTRGTYPLAARRSSMLDPSMVVVAPPYSSEAGRNS